MKTLLTLWLALPALAALAQLTPAEALKSFQLADPGMRVELPR